MADNCFSLHLKVLAWKKVGKAWAMTITIRGNKEQQKARYLYFWSKKMPVKGLFFCFLIWASHCTCYEKIILTQSVSSYLPWHPESPSFAVLNNLQNIRADYFPWLSTDPIHIDVKIYIVPVRCEFKDAWLEEKCTCNTKKPFYFFYNT